MKPIKEYKPLCGNVGENQSLLNWSFVGLAPLVLAAVVIFFLIDPETPLIKFSPLIIAGIIFTFIGSAYLLCRFGTPSLAIFEDTLRYRKKGRGLEVPWDEVFSVENYMWMGLIPVGLEIKTGRGTIIYRTSDHWVHEEIKKEIRTRAPNRKDHLLEEFEKSAWLGKLPGETFSLYPSFVQWLVAIPAILSGTVIVIWGLWLLSLEEPGEFKILYLSIALTLFIPEVIVFIYLFLMNGSRFNISEEGIRLQTYIFKWPPKKTLRVIGKAGWDEIEAVEWVDRENGPIRIRTQTDTYEFGVLFSPSKNTEIMKRLQKHLKK